MPCANHPEVAEAAACGKCGKRFCMNCLVSLEGAMLCGPCKNVAARKVERGETLDTTSRSPSPWEQGKSFGSLVQTWKQALFSPKVFFRGLALYGKGHWSYIIVIAWPAQALAVGAQQLMLSGADVEGETAAFAFGVGVGGLVFFPLLLAIGTMIGCAILHGFLRLCGGARAKMDATLRAYCYAQSTTALQWIPFVGALAGIWMMVVLAIALKEMHQTTYGRVIAAMVLPGAALVMMMLVGMGMIQLSR